MLSEDAGGDTTDEEKSDGDLNAGDDGYDADDEGQGEDEEEEGEVVYTKMLPKVGKGKGVAPKGRELVLSEEKARELMHGLVTCDLKLRDAQAQILELEAEVMGLRSLMEWVCCR